MIDDYITISAYAKKNKIRKSKVYELIQIDGNKQYFIEKNGIKYVSSSMPVEQNQNFAEKAERKPVQNKPDAETAKTQRLYKEIEELKEKNKQLEERIIEKDRKITEITETVISLLERQQDLTEKSLQIANQSQILQALPQKKQGFFKRLFSGKKETE